MADNRLRRGTTPTHIFDLSIDTGQITQLRITYHQLRREVLELTQDDVTMDGTTIRATLTQEQTLAFDDGHMVHIQLRVLTNTGTALASDIMTIPAEPVLNEEVLE